MRAPSKFNVFLTQVSQ